MKNFIKELKRRSVIKSAMAYLVVAWVLIQVSEILLPMVDAPEWVLKILTLIMAIGLPIWIIISWIYDITPEGIEKTPKVSDNRSVAETTNKRLNAFIIVSLSIAVIAMGLKLFNSSSDVDQRYVIAVLPFDQMNVDDDSDWISKGLATDIHTYMSKIENLTIISESSVKEALASKKSLPEIAKLLNVTYFIGGSVSQFKNDIKISVHLTKTGDDIDEWAENYNRNLDNPFQVQQDVSQKIVAQLKVALTPEELKTLQKFPTENMEAYELFVKGRILNKTRNKEDLDSSIELFEQALVLDPDFADAYAEMAISYFRYGFEGITKAKDCIEKALKINPNTAMAYAVMARIAKFEHNWGESKENIEKAIALNPNDAWIQSQYADYFENIPIPDQKKRLYHFRIAHSIVPLDKAIAYRFIMALIYNEKFKEAEENLNKLGFLLSLGHKTELEILLEVFKAKNWTAEITYWEREIEKDPNDIKFLYYHLAKAYHNILNDHVNFIKYAKKAFELDSASYRFGDLYFVALLRGKRFKEAKKISQSKNFRALYENEAEWVNNWWSFYYYQENYKKAAQVLHDSLGRKPPSHYEILNTPFTKILTYAQLGDRKKVDSILIDYYELNRTKYWLNIDKAIVFAIMKEKDSMYHYLEKLRPIEDFFEPNSRFEFDPYRKEERFKALLKKHYLPLTHWNE